METSSTIGVGEGSINDRLCFSGLTITITMPKKRQEKMMKKLGAWLGVGGHAEGHAEEKAEGYHMDGQKFPRFSSTPKFPNQNSLAK